MNDNGLMDQPTAFRLALRASKTHHHRYRVWGYRSSTGHWRYLISRLPDVVICHCSRSPEPHVRNANNRIGGWCP